MRKPEAKSKPQSEYVQLSLVDLLRRLEENAEPVHWNVASSDIGGEVLAILSKGLYTNPLDCIREYVQNAVDASASNVTIKVTANSVVIHDDGAGMDLDGVVQARQFGLSQKLMTEKVGFRGIGIYSGFDLCNRLLITSKRTGENFAYVIEFDFGQMKRQLEAERLSGSKARTPLTDLITQYSQFTRDPEDPSLHYTTVQLEDISKTHIDRLADRAQLRSYVLRNLPVDFADDFPGKDRILSELRREIRGYNVVKIILESSTASSETLARPTIENLAEPKIDFVRNSEGKAIAMYWACMYHGRGQIPESYADYKGFVYKVRGFTIGANRDLERLFKKKTLYWWYTGEVFVLDHNVVPNAARDDFETSPEKLKLDTALIDVFKGLEKDVSDYQERARADQKFQDGAKMLATIRDQVNDASYDSYDTFAKLDRLLSELKAQKNKTSDRESAEDLVRQVDKLKGAVRRHIDHPDTPVKPSQPKQAKSQDSTAEHSWYPKTPEPSNSDSAAEGRDEPTEAAASEVVESRESQTEVSLSEPPAFQPDQNVRTLTVLLESVLGDLPDDAFALAQAIDASLCDVLVQGSDTYNELLDVIEAKISAMKVATNGVTEL